MCSKKSTKGIADITESNPCTVEAISDRLKLKGDFKSTAGLILQTVKHGIVQGKNQQLIASKTGKTTR